MTTARGRFARFVHADHPAHPLVGSIYDVDGVLTPGTATRDGVQLSYADIMRRYPLTALCETCRDPIICLESDCDWGHYEAQGTCFPAALDILEGV